MFGLLEKKCPVCGKKLEGNPFELGGKKFCSEEHARQHDAEAKELATKIKGCCGLTIED